jgi:DNA-binding winged helix-turn-helix (wHTH) protein
MSTTQDAPARRLLAFGNFIFDTNARTLIKAGVVQKVDPKPLALLEAFLAAPQTLLTRKDLLERIWGTQCVAESALSVVVAKLRRTLGRAPDNGDYIENTYGKGYRLRVLVDQLGRAQSSAPQARRAAIQAFPRSGVSSTVCMRLRASEQNRS